MFVSVETANMCDEKKACIMRSTLIQCVACSICSVFTSHAYEHGDELARSLARLPADLLGRMCLCAPHKFAQNAKIKLIGQN